MALLNLTALTGTVAALAAGAVATGATLTGVGSADPDPDPDGAADLRLPCGAVWDRLPDSLQTDLRALRDLDPAERPAAAREIRRDALQGAYGERVERFAEQRRGHRAEVWRRLPVELKADVRAAKALPADERVEAFRAIGDQAVAGEYGERVQQVATTLRERREACGTAS